MKKYQTLVLALGLVAFTDCSSPQNQQNRQQQGQRNGRQQKSATELVNEMDSNQDGKLSESEAKGPLKDHFSEIDTDNDGYLSAEELENGQPKGRQGQQGPPRN